MNHAEFHVGVEFREIGTGKLWRCTDVGQRTVIAVCLSDHPHDASWFNGPPYAVKETVFDEDSINACVLAKTSFSLQGEAKQNPDSGERSYSA